MKYGIMTGTVTVWCDDYLAAWQIFKTFVDLYQIVDLTDLQTGEVLATSDPDFE